jgi:hypothetical protein
MPTLSLHCTLAFATQRPSSLPPPSWIVTDTTTRSTVTQPHHNAQIRERVVRARAFRYTDTRGHYHIPRTRTQHITTGLCSAALQQEASHPGEEALRRSVELLKRWQIVALLVLDFFVTPVGVQIVQVERLTGAAQVDVLLLFHLILVHPT